MNREKKLRLRSNAGADIDKNSMLLDKINEANDIQKLSVNELEALAEELRLKITQTVSKNGGHLASNLGVVELSIALHYCLHFPEDN